MKLLKSSEIFIHKRVLYHNRAKNRLDLLLNSSLFDKSYVHIYSDDDVDLILKDSWACNDKRKGQISKHYLPVVIFNVFDWTKGSLTHDFLIEWPFGRNVLPLRNALLGVPGAFVFFRDGGTRFDNENRVCQSAYSFHTLWGCFSRCAYCHTGGFVIVMLDIEDVVLRLNDLFTIAPWQKLFQYDVYSDALLLEPEYGCTRKLIELFAQQKDKKLMVFTKSNNVDFLLPLQHNEHTIMCWTLSPDHICRSIETGTPGLQARLKAAKKCQNAGYEIRIKLKPIIPTIRWKEDARNLLKQLFLEINPSIITLQTLSYMDVHQLDSVFGDRVSWDPAFLEKARRCKEYMFKNRLSPFPHQVRKAVYQHYIDEIRSQNSDVLISMCSETISMWNELGSSLGMDIDHQICNCGSSSIEGGTIIRHVVPSHFRKQL